MINVSWDDATKEYLPWLNRKTGKSYRLLSEAEWEYAARAGNPGRYSFGDDETQLREYAWYRNNSGGKTQPVGQKKANAFGLYDMHGNVWQWVQDCYRNYKGGPVDGSAQESGDCSRRVVRGGSWDFFPDNLRSAFRDRYDSGFRNNDYGFRVGRMLKP